MKMLVLGAGRMGLGAAYDLAHSSDVTAVTVADLELARAQGVVSKIGNAKLKAVGINVNNYPEVVELMRGHDSVISCVTYFYNLSLAKAAIEAKANFCDLGGNNSVVAAELELDEQARAANINIIPDCGLAPGMVSVLAEHGAARFDQLQEIHIRVGGLPQQPQPPLNYQVIFSVEGLINEYSEKARVIREGQIVEVEPMSEIEHLEFPLYGEMEAFQTSGGTSTLPDSFLGRVRELDYKTIRYPGHCEKFRLLLELGLGSNEEMIIDDKSITPRRLLGEVLNRKMPPNQPDLVLVRVEFVGEQQGKTRTLVYDIVDRFDQRSGLSAMMRTTAFPASIIAQMMARGEMKLKGATPQERAVPPEAFVAALAERDIRIKEYYRD